VHGWAPGTTQELGTPQAPGTPTPQAPGTPTSQAPGTPLLVTVGWLLSLHVPGGETRELILSRMLG